MNNPFSIQSMMNEAEDADKLDELAITTLLGKEKQKIYMLNLLKEVSNLIGGYKNNNLEAIVSKLQEQRITSKSLKIACDKIIDRFDKFPSYREIKQLCYINNPSMNIDNIDEQVKYDREKLSGIRKMFLKHGTQEQLNNFVKWWLKENFSLYGSESLCPLDQNAFEMPALFDWYDTYYQWDLDKIKNICQKKKNYKKEKKIEFNTSNEWKKYV